MREADSVEAALEVFVGGNLRAGVGELELWQIWNFYSKFGIFIENLEFL